MAKTTVDLEIYLSHPDITPSGGAAGDEFRLDDLTGMEKLELGAMSEIIEALETTGLGQGKRQREIQGLEDLEATTISALANFTLVSGFSRNFRIIKASGGPCKIRVLYDGTLGNADEQSIRASWLCVKVSHPTTVGEFVMVSAELESKGEWTVLPALP